MGNELEARDVTVMQAHIDAKERDLQDLAMMMRRVCFRLRDSEKYPEFTEIREQMWGLLQRKGLQGSILR